MKMKKTPWWQAVLLAAFAAALAFGAYSVSLVGNHLQYLIAPPQKLQPSGGRKPLSGPTSPLPSGTPRWRMWRRNGIPPWRPGLWAA